MEKAILNEEEQRKKTDKGNKWAQDILEDSERRVYPYRWTDICMHVRMWVWMDV